MRLHVHKLTQLSGMLTLAAPAVGTVSAVLAYRGKHGEPYSPVNQYVSELGELGVSGHAPLFNASLMLAGLALAGFALGLGLLLRSHWAYLGAALGAQAGIACVMVGVLPMNDPWVHNLFAACCLNGILATITLLSLAIWIDQQRRLPRWLVVPGLLPMVSLAVLVSLPNLFPFLEWCVLFTVAAWIALTTASLSRARPA